jgi:hypothetical protein
MRLILVCCFLAGCGAPPHPSTASIEYRWPVIDFCAREVREMPPRVERDLGDGTKIFRMPDGTRFRGRDRMCR